MSILFPVKTWIKVIFTPRGEKMEKLFTPRGDDEWHSSLTRGAVRHVM